MLIKKRINYKLLITISFKSIISVNGEMFVITNLTKMQLTWLVNKYKTIPSRLEPIKIINNVILISRTSGFLMLNVKVMKYSSVIAHTPSGVTHNVLQHHVSAYFAKIMKEQIFLSGLTRSEIY